MTDICVGINLDSASKKATEMSRNRRSCSGSHGVTSSPTTFYPDHPFSNFQTSQRRPQTATKEPPHVDSSTQTENKVSSSRSRLLSSFRPLSHYPSVNDLTRLDMSSLALFTEPFYSLADFDSLFDQAFNARALGLPSSAVTRSPNENADAVPRPMRPRYVIPPTPAFPRGPF